MRRPIAIATFLVALIVTPLWSQVHGGRSASGFGFGFGPSGFNRGFGSSPQNFFFGSGFGRNPRFGFFPGRSPFRFGQSRHGSFGGSAYGSQYDAPYYYGYPLVAQTAPASTYYPEEYYEHGALQRDIDVLTGRVDRLEEWAAPVRRSPRSNQATDTPMTTILVFQDQHVREVQDYAIVGETLWVLNEEQADKIPLSDLDLEATTNFNDQRGIGFKARK